MASNGCTALRHGDSCHGVIGLPACVCCEAVRVAKNKLPTADLSATPSQPRRGEQNGDLSTWVLWRCRFLAQIWLSYLESFVWARTAFGCFCLCSVHGEVVKAIACHSERATRLRLYLLVPRWRRPLGLEQHCLHHAALFCTTYLSRAVGGGRGGVVIPHFLHEGYSIHFSDSVDGLQFKS